MKIYKDKILLDKVINELDRFVLEITKVLEKHTDYVIVSGYVSILFGRSRATEDIDMFIERLDKTTFSLLYKDLVKSGFWCLNTGNFNEAYNYLNNNMAVRFARKNEQIPNCEIKFPKDKVDEETLKDTIVVEMPSGKIKISSIERQIAFKKYYLKSEKDIEDAKHLETLFKEKIDKEKIYKYKELLRKR